jgi:hypothetical protein
VEEALESNLALVATLRDPAYGGSPAIVGYGLGSSAGPVAVVAEKGGRR